MNYEKSCGAVVYTRVNGEIRYVILQQVTGYHGLPKGHMEPDETERETALREILEEVGLKVSLLDDFRIETEYVLPRKKDTMKQVVYFLAEYADQELTPQEAEVKNVRLMSLDEALETVEHENIREILEKAAEFLKNR